MAPPTWVVPLAFAYTAQIMSQSQLHVGMDGGFQTILQQRKQVLHLLKKTASIPAVDHFVLTRLQRAAQSIKTLFLHEQ